MNDRPRLLDLFSGAGGAARGYQLAGFHVTGIDIKPQPRYAGDIFIQGDALEFCREHGHEFDVIHASPPCQGYSRMRHLPWLKDKQYPMLIDSTRDALIAAGRPWVIENVEDAPLLNGVVLCGAMFGLKVYRHRKFESNRLLLSPPHGKHTVVIGAGRMLNDRQGANADGWVSHAGKGTLNRNYHSDGVITVGGHNFKMAAGAEAMGINWMSRDELSQAIPPAYTSLIGTQLLAHIAPN